MLDVTALSGFRRVIDQPCDPFKSTICSIFWLTEYRMTVFTASSALWSTQMLDSIAFRGFECPYNMAAATW